MKLSLRFKKSEISHWSSRYQVDSMEDFIEKKLRPTIQANKYLTSTQLLKLCKWKTPRTKSRVAKNSEEFIRVVTETAFSTPSEQLRIEVLTLLQGVSWPTASVLLHFGSSEPYPILDFRALWTLGLRVPKQYDFNFGGPIHSFVDISRLRAMLLCVFWIVLSGNFRKKPKCNATFMSCK